MRGISVLAHSAWIVSKRCSLPIPLSQSKGVDKEDFRISWPLGPRAWTSALCIIGAC